jgi:acyl transferase domain-containing protein
VGRELFRASNIFRKSILECDAIHERMTGYSLILKYGLFDECVEPENLLDDIWPIAVTLPALTMIQLALMDTLSFIGLKPDVVVGHSAGETAVLYASGAASKEMVVQLSIARGRGLTPLEDLGGSMVAINCTLNEAEEIIAQVTDQLGSGVLEIGCYNDAHAFTLSGSNAQLDRAVQIATKNGIFARKLKTRVAVHSSMMEHCREVYRKGVNSVFASHKLVQPVATIYSAALGEVMHEAGYSEYFWKNSRGAVHFSQAIQAIIKEYPAAAFLEIGPHPVLSGYLSSLAGLDAIVACPLRRVNPKKPETDVELTSFLTAIGQMAIAGHHIDFSSLVSSNTRTLSHCPAYPFQRKSLPVILPTPEIQRIVRDRNGPLNFPELCVNTATHPSLSDHIIKSTPIMPAAGYIEMVRDKYGCLTAPLTMYC